MTITLEPIGRVHGGREDNVDDGWGAVEAEIVLDPSLPEEALAGLDAFSHAVVVFHFDMIDPEKIATGLRRPRGRADLPEVGLVGVEHEAVLRAAAREWRRTVRPGRWVLLR